MLAKALRWWHLTQEREVYLIDVRHDESCNIVTVQKFRLSVGRKMTLNFRWDVP